MSRDEMIDNLYRVKLAKYDQPDNELQTMLYIEAVAETDAALRMGGIA